MDFFFSAIGSDQNTAGEGCPRGKGDIGIFKPGQVHLDKGYFYQNIILVFVFGKGHIGPNSLEQRMSSENVIFFVFGIFKPGQVHSENRDRHQNIAN